MAAVNTQFSIAVHLVSRLGITAPVDLTSETLAKSVNASPSFVRRVVAKLAKAGLIRTTRGKDGACVLAREPKAITLLDIYRAVDPPKAFAIHAYPPVKGCAVSCNIHTVLQGVLDKAQNSVEASLRKTTLAEVVAAIRNC